MESIFEESEALNISRGGWKAMDKDQDTLDELLRKPSLLQEPIFASKMYQLVEGRFSKYYVQITREVLFMKKNKSDEYDRWMHLTFRRVQMIQHSDRIGAKLMGGGAEFDMYFHSQRDMEKWMEYFTEYCVFLNLPEYYQVEREVGSGNYAKVYLGKEIMTQQQVAVKSVSKETVRASHRGISAIVHEIECMRGLKHPALCSLFAVFEDEMYIHLIMEYCAGGELFTRIIKRGAFNEYSAAQTICNILSALVFLHEVAWVVHRDIKPENLMMCSQYNDHEIKIADFGLATKYTESDLNLKCGSPGYVAPEILKNHVYGPKVDVFSTGILLYILLCGRSPFNGRHPQEVLIQNRDCKILFKEKYWKNISREAMHCVIVMTEPNPLRRITARDALQHPYFKMQRIPNSPLIPAHEVLTPCKKIEPLSPSTPSTKVMSRETLSKKEKNKYFDDGSGSNVNVPAVPTQTTSKMKTQYKAARSSGKRHSVTVTTNQTGS